MKSGRKTHWTGIIISLRMIAKKKFLNLKFRRPKAKAAGTMTTIISPVVAAVKIRVFRKYRASGTALKASR